MSKERNNFIEFRTLRAGKNGGTVFIITPTNSGDMIFEMALQSGTQNVNGRNLPQFDYQNKTIFGLSDLEMASLVIAIERQLMSGGFAHKLQFPHLESKVPKNIEFEFSQYNNKPQMKAFVAHKDTNQLYSIYMNENEMEVIKEFCKAQYNPALKRITLEYHDDRNFKQFVADALNRMQGGQN